MVADDSSTRERSCTVTSTPGVIVPTTLTPAAAETDDPEVEASAADRVVVFSDAVVAIAITLLALALPVPDTASAGRAAAGPP
jgi:Endosomal/lysosomal potassium channel TMEM175